MTLNESTVEAAGMDWFAELGWTVAHGPDLAPGESGAERTLSPALSRGERGSYGDVVLVGRLREAIRRLHQANSNGPFKRLIDRSN